MTGYKSSDESNQMMMSHKSALAKKMMLELLSGAVLMKHVKMTLDRNDY